MNLLGLKLLIEGLGDLENYMPKTTSNQLQNLTPFRVFLEKIRYVPGVAPFISRLQQQDAFKSTAPAVPLNAAERTFVAEAFALRDYLKTVLTIANTTLATEATASDIYLKFANAGDLPALTQQLTTFQKILEQTILDPAINGKMVIKSVDNGSFIIQLYLGTAAAVTFIGGLAWAAAVAYKKYQEALLVKMHVEALEIKNEALTEIKDAQRLMLQGIVTAEARHLEKETYGGEEIPERLERIKHSIELMQGLIEKGAEVHPALLAPEQVKNLFPDFHKLGSVESRIKQISEKAIT